MLHLDVAASLRTRKERRSVWHAGLLSGLRKSLHLLFNCLIVRIVYDSFLGLYIFSCLF